MDYLPAIQIETQHYLGFDLSSPSVSIIWLHGLGASGQDFADLVPELIKTLKLDVKSPNIRCIFPHAAEIPVTINGGFVMPAWYDIFGMPSEPNAERKINTQQLLDSVNSIQRLIDREIKRGVASEKILLLGFSQGGAVAYHAALTYPETLAGLAGLSTYFPTQDLDFAPSEKNQNIDIQIYHGSFDPVVNEALGLKAQEDLDALGYQTSYQSYPMQHQLCLEQVEDISRWIKQQVL